MNYTLIWKDLQRLEDLSAIIERSKTKPVLIFKHSSSSAESTESKTRIEREWSIPPDQLDCCIIDVTLNDDISMKISELAGVPDACPQFLLFADEVTVYEESHELISVKKIKLALRIINRTFRWLETRV